MRQAAALPEPLGLGSMALGIQLDPPTWMEAGGRVDMRLLKAKPPLPAHLAPKPPLPG